MENAIATWRRVRDIAFGALGGVRSALPPDDRTIFDICIDPARVKRIVSVVVERAAYGEIRDDFLKDIESIFFGVLALMDGHELKAVGTAVLFHCTVRFGSIRLIT